MLASDPASPITSGMAASNSCSACISTAESDTPHPSLGHIDADVPACCFDDDAHRPRDAI
ncbi:hypothetical protein [Burkholderia pseudomultivorans]|nr:hypothetical protein [Burkholderia pseudomultivorans]